MILADFHIHSSNSGDCEIPMKTQIDAAISKGLCHLCFTEHLDIDYPAPPKGYIYDSCDFNLDADKYLNEFLDVKSQFSKSNPAFNLYYGVEIGLQEHIVDSNNAFIYHHPFDFVIASMHLLNGADPYYKEYWTGKDDEAEYRSYFESIYKNICLFNNFDVLGHLDYIVRYGASKDENYSYLKYSDVIDPILIKIIEMGKGLEINTGGLKYGLKSTNPSLDILKRYKELGGKIITIGSDAHSPEYVAYEFSKAEDILKAAGFNYYNVFRARMPMTINL